MKGWFFESPNGGRWKKRAEILFLDIFPGLLNQEIPEDLARIEEFERLQPRIQMHHADIVG